MSVPQTIFVISLLILVEGFFSGSEIALLSADRLSLKKLAKQGSKGAHLALELIKSPQRILSTTLFVTCICVMMISAIVEISLRGFALEGHALIAILITSPLVLFFGELIPKTLYRRYSNELVPVVVYPVWWAYYVFYPFTRLLSNYTSYVSRLIKPIENLVAGRKRNTREELQSMLRYGKRESEIKASEKRMIKRIFDFKDTEAKHALIPLVKVIAVEAGAPLLEAVGLFEKHRHSRMPIYQDRVDNIVGVIEVFDIFNQYDFDKDLQQYMRPALFAAETQTLDDVLVDMDKANTEMAIVVDEHGGAVGILTLEDIFEEIVGEIQDEFDTDKSPYAELEENKWVCEARTEITSLNEQLRLNLPLGDYETLSGLLLQQFGRIPEQGDELYLDTPEGSIKFTIKSSSPKQIHSVILEKLTPPNLE